VNKRCGHAHGYLLESDDAVSAVQEERDEVLAVPPLDLVAEEVEDIGSLPMGSLRGWSSLGIRTRRTRGRT
jgi:hypothetical protein